MGDLGRISILLAIALLGPIHARGQESALRLDPIGTFVSPVFVTHAGDGSGRLFVVEQAGVIRALKPGVAGSTAFLDIRDRVLAGGERGLLGLAFHPAFEANRRFFVNYTRRNDGATVIAGYEATPDGSMSAGQETILLVVEQPFANHNGGMLAFGPDGFLYIGSGDGGSAFDPGNRAQDTTTLLGKLLRIDVDSGGPGSYSSPPTNPLAGGPGRDEVFATGFRNPWRSGMWGSRSWRKWTSRAPAGTTGGVSSRGPRARVGVPPRAIHPSSSPR
jgi:glucose/arabinose dehydrogenase